MSTLRISVPARAEFIHVLRLVVAGVAARLDLPYDALEDVRLAVDEACSQLLRAGAPANLLELRITSQDELLEIVASTDAQDAGWPPPGVESGLSGRVLKALADQVSFERVENGPSVRIVKRIPSAGADR